MVDQDRREAFAEKYKNGDKVWSGGTFTGYLNLRTLLDELPVSDVAEASRDYPRRYAGMEDNVYGELIHHLLSFEGYLQDKAYPIEECAIQPIIRDYKLFVSVQYPLHHQGGGGASPNLRGGPPRR